MPDFSSLKWNSNNSIATVCGVRSQPRNFAHIPDAPWVPQDRYACLCFNQQKNEAQEGLAIFAKAVGLESGSAGIQTQLELIH